jgi:hypothetical protein
MSSINKMEYPNIFRAIKPIPHKYQQLTWRNFFSRWRRSGLYRRPVNTFQSKLHQQSFQKPHLIEQSELKDLVI